MSTLQSELNRDERTMTISTDLVATPERAWQLWEDPRQLERWWGPPTWPASFTTHEFEPGGKSRYHMTGPDGETSPGWWTTTLVEPVTRYEFDDGFADAEGEPIDPADAAHCIVTLTESPTGTLMTVTTVFTTVEQLDRMIAMGMREGMTEAMRQIDAILAG